MTSIRTRLARKEKCVHAQLKTRRMIVSVLYSCLDATVENTRGRLSELQNSGQNQNDIVLGNLTKHTSDNALAGTAITVIETSLPERLQPALLLLGCTAKN